MKSRWGVEARMLPVIFLFLFFLICFVFLLSSLIHHSKRKEPPPKYQLGLTSLLSSSPSSSIDDGREKKTNWFEKEKEEREREEKEEEEEEEWKWLKQNNKIPPTTTTTTTTTNWFTKNQNQKQTKREGIAICFSPEITLSLPFVIRTTLLRLPNHWDIAIVVKERVGSLARQLLLEVESSLSLLERGGKRLFVLDVLKEDFDRRVYSCFLLSFEFYLDVPAEHILIFQTDSLILHQDDGKKDRQPGRHYYLRDFYDYPYIGSPWLWRDCTSDWNVDKLCRDSGNGGLSLRRRSAMLYFLSQMEQSFIDQCYAEDLAFVGVMDQTALQELPPRSVGRAFSVESLQFSDPFGVHKPWMFMSSRWVKKRSDVHFLKVLNLQPKLGAFLLKKWGVSVGLSSSFFKRLKFGVVSGFGAGEAFHLRVERLEDFIDQGFEGVEEEGDQSGVGFDLGFDLLSFDDFVSPFDFQIRGKMDRGMSGGENESFLRKGKGVKGREKESKGGMERERKERREWRERRERRERKKKEDDGGMVDDDYDYLHEKGLDEFRGQWWNVRERRFY